MNPLQKDNFPIINTQGVLGFSFNEHCIDQIHQILLAVWEELRQAFSYLIDFVTCCFKAKKIVTPHKVAVESPKPKQLPSEDDSKVTNLPALYRKLQKNDETN